MSLDLNAIKARADAATDGPWTTGRGHEPGWLPHELIVSASYPIVEFDESVQGAADAEFSAHAREDVPALLAALAAVEQDRDHRLAELAQAMDLLNRGRRIISSIHARDNGPLGEAAKRWRDRYYTWTSPQENDPEPYSGLTRAERDRLDRLDAVALAEDAAGNERDRMAVDHD